MKYLNDHRIPPRPNIDPDPAASKLAKTKTNTMSPINNAPYNPITTPVVTCSICRNEQTIARSATSETLKRWNVVSYPNDCHCPKCSGIKPRVEPPTIEEPPAKKPTPRKYSKTEQYHQAAIALHEFTTKDFIKQNPQLPNISRAGAYLWGLLHTGKLEKVGPARFKIKEVTN